MNLITRAKGIIAAPNHEWDVTRTEAPNTNQIIMGYVIVSFRVWDKNSNGEVTGSYKLRIQ